MAEVTARRRDSGVWEYRIELAKIDGKRQQKSKSGFRTKTEALKAGREALRLYENGGQIITPVEMSVSDLLDKWLEEYGKTDLQQVTTEGYAKKIRLYIKPVIGHYKARSITRQILQELVSNLADKGYSKNTVSSVRGILTSCFDWAEMNKMIVQTPAYRLKLPKKTAVKQRTDKHVYIPKEKMDEIFKRFPEGSPSYLPIRIAYHCGLRLGEVYALTWDDIDFENKLLSVNRQVQWYQDKTRTKDEISATNGSKQKGGGYWYFSPPKYNSYRTIEIDEFMLDILKREFEKQKKASEYYAERYYHYYSSEAISLRDANHDEDSLMNPFGTDKTDYEIQFVNRRESGEYITPRTMQHTSSVIHKQLDFIEFDFHSLRHTHATMLLENGAPMIYIKNRLGHVKVETTEKVYTNHLTDALESQGSETLNSVFNK